MVFLLVIKAKLSLLIDSQTLSKLTDLHDRKSTRSCDHKRKYAQERYTVHKSAYFNTVTLYNIISFLNQLATAHLLEISLYLSKRHFKQNYH